MSRRAKLFLLIHAFSFYTVLDLQFGYLLVRASNLAYIALPTLFTIYCLYLWLTTSHIKLNKAEKCNIKMFIWFYAVIGIYNEICTFVGNATEDGYWWIRDHDGYLVFFFIFIILFNIINYLSRENV
jgi:hypothetical protein